MSINTITAAMLNVAGVTALVGTRRALSQLPQGTAMPALVYQVVSSAPNIGVPQSASAGSQRMTSRVQVTALAMDIAGVESVLAAVMAAMVYQHGTYAGQTVSAVLRDVSTPIERDSDVGVWYGSQDFIVHWFD